MTKRIIILVFFAILSCTCSLHPARAADIVQTFNLGSGWNSIFLKVDPLSTDPADVFADLIQQGVLVSVWAWNPRTGTVEFIQNPNQLVPEDPQMMAYFSGNDVLTNLYAIHGERAYLINMSGAATLTVTGEPAIPDIDWKPNSFNLTGFHLEEGNEPSFDIFFKDSPAHAGQEIWRLDNASSAWVEVANPATGIMKDGEAYWIFCNGSSTFYGPTSVQLDIGTGLHYGESLGEQEIKIVNNSASNKTVSFTGSPGWMYYWVFDPANDLAGWENLNSLVMTVSTGESQRLRLAVRRANLTAGTEYKANVAVSDGEGTQILLPASITGVDFYGLWVGNATISMVNEVRVNSTPVPTGSEFSFRLIIHNGETSGVNFLKEVIQMWQEGTWKPDPNELGKQIVDNPGTFVLLGDDSLIPNYTGAAMRDGQLVGRRISTAAFGFTGKKSLVGDFSTTGLLTVNIDLPADDPSNPFMHKYHPDHRVLNTEGGIIQGQSYDVSRAIEMRFSDTDGQGRLITGVPTLSWGSGDVGGIYKETITGLSKPAQPIEIEGTFWLHKVSNVKDLKMVP